MFARQDRHSFFSRKNSFIKKISFLASSNNTTSPDYYRDSGKLLKKKGQALMPPRPPATSRKKTGQALMKGKNATPASGHPSRGEIIRANSKVKFRLVIQAGKIKNEFQLVFDLKNNSIPLFTTPICHSNFPSFQEGCPIGRGVVFHYPLLPNSLTIYTSNSFITLFKSCFTLTSEIRYILSPRPTKKASRLASYTSLPM